jgi:nucleoside-diphosphate-sugar epimerase
MRGDVLVTGSTGFLGLGVTGALAAAGWAVRAGVRAGPLGVSTGDLAAPGPGDDAALAQALRGAAAVVHLAGLAHAKAGAKPQFGWLRRRRPRASRASSISVAPKPQASAARPAAP